MANISMRTRTINIEEFGVWFSLSEIKQIVESLHATHKDGILANFMNEFHKKASVLLDAKEDGKVVSEQAMIDSNQGICKTGNCD